jgi:hypothetical protein
MTEFTITRATTDDVVIIESIEITRPATDANNIGLTIGEDELNKTLRSVESIKVMGGSNRLGYISVNAFLDGTAGQSALEFVGAEPGADGPNLLKASTTVGNISRPVTCTMHPMATPDDNQDPYPSTIDLSTTVAGSLTGHVTMESSGGTSPVLGRISDLIFERGAIGTASALVNIQADYSIHTISAGQIHANITGIGEGDGSFIEKLGFVTANDDFVGNTGRLTGEIRAKSLAMVTEATSGSVPGNLVFEGTMGGKIWTNDMEASGNEIAIEDATGLEGTVSFDSLEPRESAADVWRADVNIGPSALIRLEYSSDPAVDDSDGYSPPRTAASLGGGTMGVVLFPIHKEDSAPITPSTPLTVERHAWNSASDSDWVDMTCAFQQEIDTNAVNNGTVVILTPIVVPPATSRPVQRGFEYRVRPTTVGG